MCLTVLHLRLVCCALVLLLCCRPVLALEQLNVAYFLEWATPNLIAKSDKRYDDALGMPVNWVAFETGTQMSEAMLAGEIDIAYSQGLVPFMTAINAGSPLLMVGVAVEYPPTPCVVSNRLDIDASSDPSEFEELSVAVPRSTMADYSFRMQMDTLAVDTSRITVRDLVPAEAAAALEAGDVSMACLFGGESVKRALLSGQRLLDEQALMDAGILSFDVVSTTRQFAESNPDAVETFMRVTNAVNKEHARDHANGISTIADEAGMDVETAQQQMGSMIFPTVEDQLIIYFNKSGLADMTIDVVGQVFSSLSDPARKTDSSVIDTRFLK